MCASSIQPIKNHQKPQATINVTNNSAAVIDAQRAQQAILEQCNDTDCPPPPYALRELVGKGSFGRVYKADAIATGQIVAVKIISIEEGDTPDPRADTIGDILKEIATLKILSETGAKNINKIFDSFVFGHSVWMVTEHAAGSVATLMKPTGNLSEKWAVPILREVAEGIYWVHQHDIIHRDIKCANVLVTENGGVQLCDFGVAGILETKFDKRKTFIGTLHWMAPELFDPVVSYGKEIDIWAFGALAYELASGLPPNATRRINDDFGVYLKNNAPRLEGDQYSDQLKHLVAFCLVQDPKQRPTIEQVQHHAYIFDTIEAFPTHSLSTLISAYKLWEAHGGVRQSLFAAGGAQGSIDQPSTQEGWDFDEDYATGDFDETVSGEIELISPDEIASILRDVYGINTPATIGLGAPRRRRLPPTASHIKAPLEKVFDPNTMTTYHENAQAFYHGSQYTVPSSDLPFRKFDTPPIRESLIDLDAALDGITPDMGTIKPVSNRFNAFHRQTLEWTFPKSDLGQPSVSVSSESSVSMARDTIPVSPVSWNNRESVASLINLDASVIEPVARPSTASSTITSPSSDDEGSAFSLDNKDRTPGQLCRSPVWPNREPSIYVTDESALPSSQMVLYDRSSSIRGASPVDATSPTYLTSPTRPLKHNLTLPGPPSAKVMEGMADRDEVQIELQCLLCDFQDQLQMTSEYLRRL